MSEILQRALRNVLANWPLMLLRLAEGIVGFIIVAIGLVAAAVPVIFLFGIHAGEFGTADEFFEFYQSEPGTVIGAIVVAATVFGVILIAAVAVHAFVQAGVVGTYIEGENGAPAFAAIPAFARFDLARFAEYGRRSWLAIFWIYNLVWGAFALVILLPLLLVLLVMVTFRDMTPIIVGGCVAAAIVILVSIVVAIALDLWIQVATVLAVRSSRSARESLRDSIALAKRQFGSLLLVIAVRFGVAFASQAVFSTFYFGLGAASSVPLVGLILMPFHITLVIFQIAVSLLLQHWFIAAIVGTAVIPPERPKYATSA